MLGSTVHLVQVGSSDFLMCPWATGSKSKPYAGHYEVVLIIRDTGAALSDLVDLRPQEAIMIAGQTLDFRDGL